jgi:hypothetical protein
LDKKNFPFFKDFFLFFLPQLITFLILNTFSLFSFFDWLKLLQESKVENANIAVCVS